MTIQILYDYIFMIYQVQIEKNSKWRVITDETNKIRALGVGHYLKNNPLVANFVWKNASHTGYKLGSEYRLLVWIDNIEE